MRVAHAHRLESRRRRRRLRRYRRRLVAIGVHIPSRREFPNTEAYERWLSEAMLWRA